MKRAAIFLFLSCIYLHSTFSQDTLTYTIYFPNAVHHEAEITLRLENLPSEELTVIMSKSSPGRYATHNFAKNIYNLSAFNDTDAKVSIQKTEPNIWKISGINNA